jgi:hypothetical protein
MPESLFSMIEKLIESDTFLTKIGDPTIRDSTGTIFT